MPQLCDNCWDDDTEEYPVRLYVCGHSLCEYCAKDGCPVCAELEG